MKKPGSLSVCIIVKNEEDVFEECLESIKNIADQIIVIDTGSTDNTIEIAKKFNAEIHNFKWIDDFSAARNESIKYAKKDWIFWLDADERLIPGSIPRLKKLLRFEKKPVIYNIHIKNLKPGGQHFMLSDAHRLFNNHRGINFNGRVHEQISNSAARLKGEERDSDVFLLHLGYGYDPETARKKNMRNQPLLEKMVDEDPNNAYAHYTLAQNLGLLEKYDEAIFHYKTAYKLKKQFNKSMLASLLNTMGECLFKVKKYDEARNNFLESIRIKPVQSGAYFMQYKIANETKDYAEAARQLEKMIEMTKVVQKSKKTISSDVLIKEEKLREVLSGIYQKLGKNDLSLKCLNLPGNAQSSNQNLNKIIKIYTNSGNIQQLEQYLENLEKPDDSECQILNSLGILLIKKLEFKTAIKVFQIIMKKNPKDKNTLKKIIGLYGSIGDNENAMRLFEEYKKL